MAIIVWKVRLSIGESATASFGLTASTAGCSAVPELVETVVLTVLQAAAVRSAALLSASLASCSALPEKHFMAALGKDRCKLRSFDLINTQA